MIKSNPNNLIKGQIIKIEKKLNYKDKCKTIMPKNRPKSLSKRNHHNIFNPLDQNHKTKRKIEKLLKYNHLKTFSKTKKIRPPPKRNHKILSQINYTLLTKSQKFDFFIHFFLRCCD